MAAPIFDRELPGQVHRLVEQRWHLLLDAPVIVVLRAGELPRRAPIVVLRAPVIVVPGAPVVVAFGVPVIAPGPEHSFVENG